MNNTGANSELHLRPKDGFSSQCSKKFITMMQEYDPAMIPPDLSISETHAMAHRVSKPIEYEQMTDKFCPCCSFNSNNQQYSLCCNIRDLKNIGVSHYFSYLKMLISLVSLIGIFCCIYLSIFYYQGTNCSSDPNAKCTEDSILMISILNVQGNFEGLGFGNFFIFLAPLLLNIGNFISHFYFRFLSKRVDVGNLTASDYTVMISGLPESFKDSELTHYFERECNFGIPIKIAKIVRCYYLEDFLKCLDKRAKILFEKAVAEQKGDNEQNVLRLKEELNKVEVEMEASKHITLNLSSNGVAFVTFEDPYMMRQIHCRYNEAFITKVCHYLTRHKTELEDFEGYSLYMKRAPEPTDIFWGNLGIPLRKQILYRFLGILFAFGTWAICYVAILVVLIIRNQIHQNELDGKSLGFFHLAIYYLSPTLVSYINIFLNLIIRQAMQIVRYEDKTKFSIGVSVFLTLIQFFNTNIASVIAIYSVQLSLGKPMTELNHSTTAHYAFYMQISNSIVLPLMNVLNPNYFILLFKRLLLKRGIWKNVPQQQANFLFEGPVFDLPQRYANITLMFLSLLFFLTVAPICVLPALFGLTLSLFIDKTLLLRRHSIPAELGKEIGYTMCDFVQIGALLFIVGKIIFFKIILGSFSFFDAIIFFLVLLMSIFRFWRVMTRFFVPEFDSDSVYEKQPMFSEVCQNLVLDYDRANPIMQREAVQNFLQTIGGHNKLQDSHIGVNVSQLSNEMEHSEILNHFDGAENYENQDLDIRKLNIINSWLGSFPNGMVMKLEMRDKMRKVMAKSFTFQNLILNNLGTSMIELPNLSQDKGEDMRRSAPAVESPSLRRKLDESIVIDDDNPF